MPGVILKDAVLETTTTTGTGALSVAGAQTGYNAIRDKFADGAWGCFVAEQIQTDSDDNITGIDREVFFGKVTYGTPDTISRPHVISSTNSDANVDFGAGTKDIYCAPGSVVFGWNLADVESRTTAKTLTIKLNNTLLLLDATAGVITQALPASADIFAGYRVGVMKSDSGANAVTLDGDGADTINGAATYDLTSQRHLVWLVWTGSEWIVEHQTHGNNFDAWATFYGVGRLSNVNAYTANQYYTQQALTDDTTVDWDLDAMPSAKLTMAGDRTINNPSNIRAEVVYVMLLKQDATGSRNPSWGANYDFTNISGGIAPDLSARAANKEDVLIFLGNNTDTKLECIKHVARA
tara:strand:- start:2965 stop:4017 length:1053 start_codon:yes stop_codon:yes gene_type:complete